MLGNNNNNSFSVLFFCTQKLTTKKLTEEVFLVPQKLFLQNSEIPSNFGIFKKCIGNLCCYVTAANTIPLSQLQCFHNIIMQYIIDWIQAWSCSDLVGIRLVIAKYKSNIMCLVLPVEIELTKVNKAFVASWKNN